MAAVLHGNACEIGLDRLHRSNRLLRQQFRILPPQHQCGNSRQRLEPAPEIGGSGFGAWVRAATLKDRCRKFWIVIAQDASAVFTVDRARESKPLRVAEVGETRTIAAFETRGC